MDHRVKRVTKRQQELWASPTIDSQLPVQAGKTRFAEWHGYCFFCDRVIDGDMLHGQILRPIDSVTVIDAVGYCTECQLGTPFMVRIRDNGFMEWMNKEGRWVKRQIEQRESPLARLLSFCSNPLKKFHSHR